MRAALIAGAALFVALWPEAAAAAPWCGTVTTDDRPAIVGGNHVRVLYAIPSDGADRSAELAPRIAADVDEIDAWWRANDSARTVRFDLATFSCGPQADLTLVRLERSAGDLQANATRFERIVVDPGVARFDVPFTKLLLYYDGPVSEPNLCGQGGGSAGGPGIAIVYLAACTNLATAPTAAHELLHAFGGVPRSGPPNACPGDAAHVCDSTGDILYPFAQPVPLSSFVLDVNRNDYYAHGAAWPDVRNSDWLRRLDSQSALELTVRGAGSVTSDVPGVSCTALCRVDFNSGTQVRLIPAPAVGQRFVRWTSPCPVGVEGECQLVLDGLLIVTALFAPARLRLTVSVRGQGRITSTVGIICPSRCSREVTSYERAVLRAVPAQGWRLKTWSGACRGAKLTCVLPMTRVSSARAVFVLR